VRRLIVLPSPALAGIPLEVLLAAAPKGVPPLTVSYAPSGTLFAWLAERKAGPASAPRLLALGDPAFAAPEAAAPRPAHGLLLVRVQAGGSAAKAGLVPGDVLLRYAGVKLASSADLLGALREHGAEGAEVVYWRRGKAAKAKVPAGPLGLAWDRRPAPEVLKARAAGDALLARLRGGHFKPLPGTRREVEALARVLKADLLLGERASEASLAALAGKGALGGYRYLHFATHGLADPVHPLESYLALADKDLPDAAEQVLAGKPAWTGRLSARHILDTWKLSCDLVVLSACQSGLGKYEEGEGYVGFAQALFLAGARSLVVSQWEVDDDATALLMVRFYQNLLGKRTGLKKGMPKAEALAEAKRWLRNLSEKEAGAARDSLPRGKVVPRKRAGPKPYAHPWYWAGFILVGDPS
jgi:hypothetical protein